MVVQFNDFYAATHPLSKLPGTRQPPATILNNIGNTPLVHLSNVIQSNNKIEIYAKLEWFNPSGSVKDRVALLMIEQGEASGDLNRGKIILEVTSGNTGIALATIGPIKGYPVEIVMFDNVTPERRCVLNALGVRQIYDSPAKNGKDGVRELYYQIKSNGKDYWCPNQYKNEASIMAHYEGTAVEILRQLPDITAFVAGLSNF